MTEDIEKQKAKLEQFGKLIDCYSQSRALWRVPMLLIVVNGLFLIGVIGLLETYGDKIGIFWSLATMVFFILCSVFFTVWLGSTKNEKKYDYIFYKKEGQIELEREKIPAWSYVAYLITAGGPILLSAFNIMPNRWALTMALASFGLFILYVCKKQKDRIIGVILGSSCLIEATAIAAGVPTPLASRGWVSSFFIVFMMYVIGACLVTMVIVHVYNRRVLRKIRGMRLFDGQQ